MPKINKPTLFKIISVDNFDREIPGSSDDILVADNIPTTAYAETIAKALNDKYSGGNAWRYYRVVVQDTPLRKYDA